MLAGYFFAQKTVPFTVCYLVCGQGHRTVALTGFPSLVARLPITLVKSCNLTHYLTTSECNERPTFSVFGSIEYCVLCELCRVLRYRSCYS